jgi:hypothetical protein
LPKFKCEISFRVTTQSIIIRILKAKSLLTSLYKREELPLFGKEGGGEIF